MLCVPGKIRNADYAALALALAAGDITDPDGRAQFIALAAENQRKRISDGFVTPFVSRLVVKLMPCHSPV